MCVGTKFKDRVFIKDKRLRDNILSMFKGQVRPGGVVKGANVPSAQDFADIYHKLMDHGLRSLATVFIDVFDGQNEGETIFHPCLEIIRTLALKSPVCHLVKPHIWPEIESVIDGDHVLKHLPSIDHHSPMLSRLLRVANGGPAPELIRNLLTDMLEVAKCAFPNSNPQGAQQQEEAQQIPVTTGSRHSGLNSRAPGDLSPGPSRRAINEPEEQVNPVTTGSHHNGLNFRAPGDLSPGPSRRAMNEPEEWSEAESFLRTGIWSGLTSETYGATKLGGNHFYRQRPRYSADTTKESPQSLYCRKYKPDSSSHTPGIMLHWCLDCHMCVLMGMMSDAESPKTAFDHFYTLYEKAPEMISYDNG